MNKVNLPEEELQVIKRYYTHEKEKVQQVQADLLSKIHLLESALAKEPEETATVVSQQPVTTEYAAPAEKNSNGKEKLPGTRPTKDSPAPTKTKKEKTPPTQPANDLPKAQKQEPEIADNPKDANRYRNIKAILNLREELLSAQDITEIVAQNSKGKKDVDPIIFSRAILKTLNYMVFPRKELNKYYSRAEKRYYYGLPEWFTPDDKLIPKIQIKLNQRIQQNINRINRI